MANEKSQFQKDLEANEAESDKLDKELNKPLPNAPVVHQSVTDKPPLPPAKVPAPVDNTVVGSAPVITEREAAKLEAKRVAAKLKHEELVSRKARKQEIMEEYGGTRSDVPLNHPEFWNL